MEDRWRTFPWQECAEVLRGLPDPPRPDAQRQVFTSAHTRVQPPLVFPIEAGCLSLGDYLTTLPAAPGRHVVVLMQAGAASLGLFEGGEVCATKSFKRYVVRGNGRAQPTHLQGKGKSRYGSRLRLQNARRLLEELNEKLQEWHASAGPFERVYYSAPVRMWPDLFTAKSPPPFEKDGPLVRIPRDLPRPTTEVVIRAYRSLSFGRIEELPDPPGSLHSSG